MASKYRQRDESLYTEPPINEEYANNPHILPWWTDTHDLVILARIKRYRWLWHKGIADRGVSDDLLVLQRRILPIATKSRFCARS